MRITFSKEDQNFYVACSYPERDIPRRAGFRWSIESKRWYTPLHKVAARLREYADEEAQNEIKRILISIKPWSSRIPYPSNLNPLPYQIEAAQFALARNRAYLGLDPGLGKTIVASLIMNAHAGHHAIFICPPFLMLNIEAEVKKWGVPARPIQIHGRNPWKKQEKPAVWIFPDSLLTRETVRMKMMEIRQNADKNKQGVVLFVDEAHRFKNMEAARTRALFGYRPKTGRVVRGLTSYANFVYFMSGTPMPNRPFELYPVLSNAAPETIDFMNVREFGEKYCAGKLTEYGWDFTGASNVPELAKKVFATFMIRMRKEVLKLPPSLEEAVIIGDHLPVRLARIENKLLEEHGGTDLMRYLAKNDEMSTYRKELGSVKVGPSLPFIRAILEETEENVLVFAIHKEAIQLLLEGLKDYQPLWIGGEVPTEKRLAITKEFSSNCKRRVLVMNIQAGGVGFNLTKATRVVFTEFSWVPAENEQAIGRAHRFGQGETVVAHYLIFKNSIDRAVMETVLRKKRITEHV